MNFSCYYLVSKICHSTNTMRSVTRIFLLRFYKTLKYFFKYSIFIVLVIRDLLYLNCFFQQCKDMVSFCRNILGYGCIYLCMSIPIFYFQWVCFHLFLFLIHIMTSFQYLKTAKFHELHRLTLLISHLTYDSNFL